MQEKNRRPRLPHPTLSSAVVALVGVAGPSRQWAICGQ
jgi:hypothetical protein